jgi:hypothetical protein
MSIVFFIDRISFFNLSAVEPQLDKGTLDYGDRSPVCNSATRGSLPVRMLYRETNSQSLD